MTKLYRWARDYFVPDRLNRLDTSAIVQALNDPAVRGLWIKNAIEELTAMNLEVDRRLLNNLTMNLIDLCARRKAYQDMLEAILTARRVVAQELPHNPRPVAVVDLDRVTV